MPEVVEVCLTALWLNHELKNSILTDIKILGGRYSRHALPGLNLFKKANNYKIKRVDSKGKFMWIELLSKDNKPLYILNKFGLSGEWGFTKEDHSGIKFTVKKGNKIDDLYFTDPRNFGTIEITDSKKRLDKELNKIGPDFLKEDFSNQDFYDRIEDYLEGGRADKSRANKEIVKVLMDQTAKNGLGSGLGNYLSVSVLYHAKMSPYTKIGDIYKSRVLSNRLASSIRYIVKLAYLTATIGYLEHLDPGMTSFLNNLRKDINKNKDSPYNFHPDTVIKKGDEFKFEVYRQIEDPLGNPVIASKIIPGRTTYWAPNVQK
ncbi:MAG: formamidopyrimidine-DNA glycosylase [Barrevirus sp.]|uniref:Formamidopyrimidine-DNA glycosylase n=1 Tax=Barrevirus sp. TaxID=2487763 RepID=A0A3G4ZQ57_9VIRU|nr:MAG: formamidopyrimidine-DNA glycosylase [Barrevirus sp.]